VSLFKIHNKLEARALELEELAKRTCWCGVIDCPDKEHPLYARAKLATYAQYLAHKAREAASEANEKCIHAKLHADVNEEAELSPKDRKTLFFKMCNPLSSDDTTPTVLTLIGDADYCEMKFHAHSKLCCVDFNKREKKLVLMTPGELLVKASVPGAKWHVVTAFEEWGVEPHVQAVPSLQSVRFQVNNDPRFIPAQCLADLNWRRDEKWTIEEGFALLKERNSFGLSKDETLETFTQRVAEWVKSGTQPLSWTVSAKPTKLVVDDDVFDRKCSTWYCYQTCSHIAPRWSMKPMPK
jgi:hypothetical protein